MQRHKFIQRQPLPRKFHVRQFIRKMNHAHRVCARRKIFQVQLYVRLGDFILVFFQRAPDERAHHARRQSFRQRMHRDDAIDVDKFIVASLDQLRFGMREDARFFLVI